MKVAPVSSDLLIELALAAAVIGAALWAAKRAGGAVSEAAGKAWDTATAAAWSISPTNQNNVIYGTANAVGGALVTDPAGAGKNADGSWTLGGALQDWMNPGTAQAFRDLSAPVNTGGATGSW